MSKILFIQNKTREHPGMLATILKGRGIAYDVVDLDKNETLPDPEQYDCLMVLGGPDSANDTTDKMLGELEFTGKWLETGKPYFGICLGLQVMVKAAGGIIKVNPTEEHGFFDHEGEPFSVSVIQSDPLLDSLPDEFRVFQLHGETVEPTDTMTLLASGTHCENQIIKAGPNQYGVQFHLELDKEMMELWATEDESLVAIGTEKLINQFEEIYENYEATGKKFLNNFLDAANL